MTLQTRKSNQIEQQYFFIEMASKHFCRSATRAKNVHVLKLLEFVKQEGSAEARVKNDCLHDQLTPIFAVLANHHMLTIKVKYAHLLLIGLKSDFMWTCLVWGVCVCYFCPCSMIIQASDSQAMTLKTPPL